LNFRIPFEPLAGTLIVDTAAHLLSALSRGVLDRSVWRDTFSNHASDFKNRGLPTSSNIEDAARP
jgi:hypothetical protein